ncbi:hypothetical protein [Paracoccus pacificus]|uniref:MetA-pathway of phenol degradation n=1 Tax=Paracoccus pacificus TaxID=1463598 RepID=A0ABW4R856_9RHOB
MCRPYTARLIAALILLTPPPAHAGPWPRDAGTTFLAFSVEGDRNRNAYAGLYGEYGLSARNTLGFELGYTDAEEISGLIWFQRTLDGGEGPDRWAVSLGVGAVGRGGSFDPVGQVGMSWGRGFDAIPGLRRLHGGGWFSVDARLKFTKGSGAAEKAGAGRRDGNGFSAVFTPGPFSGAGEDGADASIYAMPARIAKAELTIGWNATDRLMWINQFRFEDRSDTGYSGKLATTLVYGLTKRSKIEFGLIAPLSEKGEVAVKLGCWMTF